MTIKGLVPDIDEVEALEAAQPQMGLDLIMMAIPAPTFVALSDAAAKRNMTLAQLVTKAFNLVLEEQPNGRNQRDL